MAGITLSGWPSGATVSAYATPTTPSSTPDTDALGSALTSGVANAAGQVTLGNLNAGTRYIASDGTSRKRFFVSASSPADRASSVESLMPVASARIFGLQTWSHDPGEAGATSAPVAGTRYGASLPLMAGQIVSTIHFHVAVGGAGTVPTAVYAGLASPTVMLRGSGDVKASGTLAAAGFAVMPLSSPVEVPASGLYYAIFLQVGAWGTTQMTLNRYSAPPTFPNGSIIAATFGTAQTGLAADGASPGTLSGSGAFRFWAGAS